MTDIVAEIHKSKFKGVIAITGCAPGLVTELLQPGGGSATLLDAVVPYATKALQQFIGYEPTKYCTAQVATEMASSAFSRATELNEAEVKVVGGGHPEGLDVFGLGITATLRKNGPEREGRVHQVFISFQTCNITYTHHVVFNSELTRLDEEYLVTQIALDVLARHLLDKRHPIRPQLSDSRIFSIMDGKTDNWFVSESTQKQQYPRRLRVLLNNNCEGYGEDTFFWVPKAKKYLPWSEQPFSDGAVVIPGSFNPFHEAHQKMVDIATKHFGKKPVLELSISNVDKGRLSGSEVLKRVNAFQKYVGYTKDPLDVDFADFVVTDAPTFAGKSHMFHGATFVIGIDTWYRLIDYKYYNYSQAECDAALKTIRDNECSFLVLGRFINGSYHTLPSDERTRGLAIGLSEDDFRMDISSSQKRIGK
jgi:hypothetical protein